MTEVQAVRESEVKEQQRENPWKTLGTAYVASKPWHQDENSIFSRDGFGGQ